MSESRQFSDGYIRVSYEEIFRLTEEIRRICSSIAVRIDALTAAADITPDWDTDSSDVVKQLAKTDFGRTEELKSRLFGLHADLSDILSVYRAGENAVIEESRDLPPAIIR